MRKVLAMLEFSSSRDFPTMRFAMVTMARQTTSLPEPLVKVMPLSASVIDTRASTICLEVGMVGVQDDEGTGIVWGFVHCSVIVAKRRGSTCI